MTPEEDVWEVPGDDSASESPVTDDEDVEDLEEICKSVAATAKVDVKHVWDIKGLDLTGVMPVFRGWKYGEHVEAWLVVDGSRQRHVWVLAAIAVSLTRSVGGSPRGWVKRGRTRIQCFCDDVRIDRQTFQRYCHTYKAFSGTCTTGGTRFIPVLSFKHHEIAARLVPDDPVAALAEAHEKDWSANKLGRELLARQDKALFSLDVAIAKVRSGFANIVKQILEWPEDAQQKAPEILKKEFQGALNNLAEPTQRLITLTPQEAHAARWIRIELDQLPFVPRTFHEGGPGRGGDLEVISGAAGAPIYGLIVGDTSQGPGRWAVIHAIDNLLAGKLTPLGSDVLLVVRQLARGDWSVRRYMKLEPEAGGVVTGTVWARGAADDLPECFRELVVPDHSDPIGQHDEEVEMAVSGVAS